MTERVRNKPTDAAMSAAAMEIPEADVAEQRRAVLDDDEIGTSDDEQPVPFDVDAADAAEQRMEVGFDDDEYR